METTKTFQFKITYLENGAVKTEQYDKEFTPFELLGIVTHIKNEIEVDLLQLSKRKNETTLNNMKTQEEIIEKIIELTEVKENFSNQFKTEKSNNCEDKGLLQHLKEERDFATAQVQILTWLFKNEEV